MMSPVEIFILLGIFATSITLTIHGVRKAKPWPGPTNPEAPMGYGPRSARDRYRDIEEVEIAGRLARRQRIFTENRKGVTTKPKIILVVRKEPYHTDDKVTFLGKDQP